MNAIDPHVGSPEHQSAGDVWTFDEFRANIACAGVGEVVNPIVETSVDAARDFADPVELAFIDGAHELEMAKLDLDVWLPKIIEGGWITMHDTLESSRPRTSTATTRPFGPTI